MKYFETITANAFKNAPNGELLYYPNGPLSKGRVVPNEETRVTLYNFQKRSYKLALFFCLPYSYIIGNNGLFATVYLSPVVLMVFYIVAKQYMLTRDLEKHELKLGFNEAAAKNSQALPNWYYWFTGIFSTLIIILALALPYLLNTHITNILHLVFGLLPLGLLGLGFAIKLYRLKNNAQPHS